MGEDVTVVSKAQQILFVHVPKTGGKSIMQLLRSKVEWDDYEFHLGIHEDVAVIKKRLQKTGLSFYSFAYVRNPWERMLSAYFFDLNGARRIEPVSFEEYIKHPEELTYRSNNGKCFPYVERCPFYKSQWQIVSIDGKVAVDRLMRFENYQKEWEALCDHLGWDESFKVLPNIHRQNREQYKGQYTTELREIVAERYRDDVEQFGYEFPSWLES